MIEWLPAILKSIGDAKVADVLREKVGLIELQRDKAIAERDVLATKLAQAQSQIELLESDKADLQAQLRSQVETLQQELEGARSEIQRLRQPPQDILPDEAEKILVLIANATRGLIKYQALQQFRLSQGDYFNLSQAKSDYCFDQLLQRKFVHSVIGQMGVGLFFHATPGGRDYLAKRGLL
ncbi:MAG: hypothetical protein DME24_24000 [Verrucomicrobia bacterium]|nr:MAG: hypothetical protein DME24_24000 [Verrucomicrobiota bacterium]